MEILKTLDIPAAIVGILVIVRWFLDDRRKDRAQWAASEIRTRGMWENHLSKSVSQQSKTADVLDRLVQEIRTLSDRLR